MKSFFGSSVGKKVLMSLAGLFLCTFLVVHLGGNLLLLRGDGGTLFNAYSNFMETDIFIRIMEVVLFAGLLFHIIDGIVLTIRNKGARPVKYGANDPAKNSSWASRNMGLTGAILFFFLTVHLKNFMFDQRFFGKYPSMFESVKATFTNPLFAILYVVTIAWLGFHLAHGFQSGFQSLGLNHPKWTPWIKCLGAIFAIVITLGFIAIPIYFYAGGA